MSFGYGGGNNNGNVLSQSVTRGASVGAQHYRYDGVNRLTIAAEGAAPAQDDLCPQGAAWCRDYDLDAYGNRAIVGASGQALKMATPTALGQFAVSNNRISAGGYDEAGNVTALAHVGVMAYDANNKMTAFDNGVSGLAGAGTYVYDGLGQRVQRTAATAERTETTTYVYDAFGKLAAEYSTAPPTSAGGTYYRTTDHLGSTRLVTRADGTCKVWQDFYPFGERILGNASTGRESWTCYGGAGTDPFEQEFTAKERDGESGLDYFGARYFSASLGRFTGPDVPFLDQSPTDPQSWNLYGYVVNRPLLFIDIDGGRKVVLVTQVRQVFRPIQTVSHPLFTMNRFSSTAITKNQHRRGGSGSQFL